MFGRAKLTKITVFVENPGDRSRHVRPVARRSPTRRAERTKSAIYGRRTAGLNGVTSPCNRALLGPQRAPARLGGAGTWTGLPEDDTHPIARVSPRHPRITATPTSCPNQPTNSATNTATQIFVRLIARATATRAPTPSPVQLARV